MEHTLAAGRTSFTCPAEDLKDDTKLREVYL
jgi:hypothetical protein